MLTYNFCTYKLIPSFSEFFTTLNWLKVLLYPILAHSWIWFLEKVLLKANLRHSLTFGGERKLVFKGGTSTYLDGWLDQSTFTPDGKRIGMGSGYNFHGCFWHACPKCYKKEIAEDTPHPRIKGMTYKQVLERTKKMDEKIRTHDQILKYSVKWEHEWKDQIKNNPFIEYFVKNCCQ